VFNVVIRACAAVEQDDEVAQARDWQDSLGRVTRRCITAPTTTLPRGGRA
jgi:hypothetical protein